jgi:hypothetical protein
MFKIIGIPKLEVDDGFLANGTAAVDEILGDEAYLGHVKMFGDKLHRASKIDGFNGSQQVFDL